MSEKKYRSGVGIILFNAQGKVFAGERKDYPEAWQFPQGGLEKDEDIHAGALRELQEEIGVTSVEFISEHPEWLVYDLPTGLKPFGGKYHGQKQKWLAFSFIGDESEINLNLHHEPEFVRWRWADFQEIIANIVEFKRPLYAQLGQYFAPLAKQKR